VGIMLAVFYGLAIVVARSSGVVRHVMHFGSSKEVSLIH
jgi:hypothetical protein